MAPSSPIEASATGAVRIELPFPADRSGLAAKYPAAAVAQLAAVARSAQHRPRLVADIGRTAVQPGQEPLSNFGGVQPAGGRHFRYAKSHLGVVGPFTWLPGAEAPADHLRLDRRRLELVTGAQGVTGRQTDQNSRRRDPVGPGRA